MKIENVETDVSYGGTVFWKRALCMLLVLLSMVSMLPIDILAADIWDGVGGGGDGNGSSISGGFWLESTSAYYAIMGYRFAVYTAGGDQVGRIIDIDIRDKNVYRTTLSGRQSHVDLYREYQMYDLIGGNAPSLGGFAKDDSEANGVYLITNDSQLNDTRSGDGPAKIGDWLGQNNAFEVAKKCEVDGYDAATHYIIVEPLFYVVLADEAYAMTMAELAVYQSAAVENGNSKKKSEKQTKNKIFACNLLKNMVK